MTFESKTFQSSFIIAHVFHRDLILLIPFFFWLTLWFFILKWPNTNFWSLLFYVCISLTVWVGGGAHQLIGASILWQVVLGRERIEPILECFGFGAFIFLVIICCLLSWSFCRRSLAKCLSAGWRCNLHWLTRGLFCACWDARRKHKMRWSCAYRLKYLQVSLVDILFPRSRRQPLAKLCCLGWNSFRSKQVTHRLPFGSYRGVTFVSLMSII